MHNAEVKLLLAFLLFGFKPTAVNKQISRQGGGHYWQEERSKQRLGQPYMGGAREVLGIPKLPQSWLLMRGEEGLVLHECSG